MLTIKDKIILTEVGREVISDIVINSKILKEKLSFTEHVDLYYQVEKLNYEQIIFLLISENVRDFEGKFGKFLKYSVAAIAGGMYLGAPAVSMLVLYLYRKLTDTCERECIKKIPLSSQKKVCKFQCQLNIAKKLEVKLRSEISKCSTMSDPDKCEKKLKGEYIKWAKRVQLLTVKVNTAKLSGEEKLRKQKQKELEKKVKTIRAGLNLSTDQTIKFISENKQLRKKLNFEQHLSLYEYCTLLEDDDHVQPVKIDPKKEKLVRQVAYLGLWVVPVPFFNDVVNYMVKKYSFACAVKCIKSSKIPKIVCYNQCAYMGAKYANDVLNQNLSKCNKSKNPVKCKKKIYDLQLDWKQREAERKIKFESSLRAAIRNQQEKNKANK